MAETKRSDWHGNVRITTELKGDEIIEAITTEVNSRTGHTVSYNGNYEYRGENAGIEAQFFLDGDPESVKVGEVVEALRIVRDKYPGRIRNFVVRYDSGVTVEDDEAVFFEVGIK